MKPADASRINRSGAEPFTRGCAGLVKTSAGILFATLFGRGREARVLRAIRGLDSIIEAERLLWCTPGCSSNVLRAYAFHPEASRGRGIARAVRTLGKNQARSGSWPGMPFAATFNALAHLDSRDAKSQVKRVLPLVKRTQNRDGTWGRGPNREFTSFLVVHSIRRIEA